MIEIDTLKASNHHYSKLCYDDTDSSEPDTALNTPTGSLTDSFSRRYSSSSSTSSFKYGTQRKPSFTPRSPEFYPQQTDLEKRIQALEHDITEHVKREADLQSQVLMLTEKHKGAPTRQYKYTLTRISKQIDHFLVTRDKKAACWNQEDWTGNEIPILYGEEGSETVSAVPNMSIPMVLIFRLKSMLDAAQPELCTEIYRTLNSWQEFYHNKLVTDKEIKAHEQSRVSRLLEALQKSLLRNKLMKKDHVLLEKKYEQDINALLNDINNKPDTNKQHNNNKGSEKSFSHTKKVLEAQIHSLEKQLFQCQDERDEYETTLEMVRREMETMLEELEDTRQQRLRYKTQASRLRAGLEAIQKRQSKGEDNRSADEDEDEEEDEGKEAIRLMYNEAERQAIDLDRECKRQALTLSGIRQELKSTEERYHSIKTEKNRDLKSLQRTNQKLLRDLELLQLEKEEASSKVEEDEERFALLVNLKAAKSDAVIQRTKISQLERQSSLADLNNSFVAGLQDLFQKELDVLSGQNEEMMKEMAKIIETEQKVWKNDSLKSFQKQFDTDLLRVNRELRFLSCKLNDMEDETRVSKTRHLEELSLLKYQSNSEFQKKIQQITIRHQLKEEELKNQLENLFQKNQTLQDESIILYGRNMLMAHKLGKIDRLPEK